MTPAARFAALIEIVDAMQDGQLAGHALRRDLQKRRYAGSGDRQAISHAFWQLHRHWARLFWHLETCKAEVTPRSIAIAAAILVTGMSAAEIEALFAGDDKHGPHALDEDEKQLVARLSEQGLDDPAMPRDVALEWPAFLIADTEAALRAQTDEELRAPARRGGNRYTDKPTQTCRSPRPSRDFSRAWDQVPPCQALPSGHSLGKENADGRVARMEEGAV